MHQPPPTPPRSNRRLLFAIIGGAAVVLVAVLWVVGTLAGPPPEDNGQVDAAPSPSASQFILNVPAPQPAPSAPSTPLPPVMPRPTARQIADRLADLYPLPNPRDNTHSCAPACRGLITTDAVSIYDWSDEASAKRWASSKDRIRVGPYVLSFAGTEQKFTSDEARAKMAAEVKRGIGSQT